MNLWLAKKERPKKPCIQCREYEAVSRGLCRDCYKSAHHLVQRGAVSWEELEAAGKCLRRTNAGRKGHPHSMGVYLRVIWKRSSLNRRRVEADARTAKHPSEGCAVVAGEE